MNQVLETSMNQDRMCTYASSEFSDPKILKHDRRGNRESKFLNAKQRESEFDLTAL